MPTTLDCTLLGDFFGTPAMRGVFDSRALLQSWLDAEAALADAEAECGLIPASAAAEIRAAARAEDYDLEELRVAILATQHPLVPLVRALTLAAGESGARPLRRDHAGHHGHGLRVQVREGLALTDDADLMPSALRSPHSRARTRRRPWPAGRTGSTPCRSRSA